MSHEQRLWVPAAAVVPQERGPDFLGAIDGAEWSDGGGLYRGFFTAFRIRAGKSLWFHFPLPTPVEQDGRPLSLQSISLLWECLDGATIGWMTVQHGGMERVELIPRLTSPAAILVPFEPELAFRQWCPVTDRQLSEIALAKPLPLRFGVQLCVMVSAPEAHDGTVRFYGAGATFSDLT
ncbi:MAG: hypothetical protein KGM49_05045 [Sphingomonadales bacterium]|nr:hypothetical protein [Sphingomonadales bacterium]